MSKKMSHRSHRSMSVAVAALGSLSLATVASAQLRPVALTGTSGPLGPGLGKGITFSDMELVKTIHPQFGLTIPAAPCISGSGSIAFGANLAGPGISTANGSCIVAYRNGTGLTLVARRGDQIPSMDAGYTFGELYTAPQISDFNSVAFQAVVEGNGSSVGANEAMFTDRSGVLFPLIREGITPVPSPHTPSGVFGASDPTGDPWGNNQWVMNRHGDVALRCFVNDPPFDYNSFSGIYTDFGGPLVESSRPGQSYFDGQNHYIFYGQSNPRMNDSGAFMTTRLTDGFGLIPFTTRARDGNGFGIPGAGPLHPLFLPGQAAPGTQSTFGTVWSLSNFSLNANGRVGFVADIDGGGPGSAGGYWSDARFGPLQLIALSGAIAPGTNGATFNPYAQFVLGSALSDNGCVILSCRLFHDNNVGAGNDYGVWSTRSITTGLPGNLRLLMREGAPVPANAGPDFKGLNFGEIQSFWVNASGRVAFTTLHNDFTRALWVEQADGTLTPVVKEFSILDVSGDGSDLRLITTIDVLEGSLPTGDGRRSSFNDDGHVAVRLVFVDGSEGIFTTAPGVDCEAPTGAVSPTITEVELFEAVLLTASFTGDGPMRFQWRHNGTPIPGATESTHNVVIFNEGAAGAYDCVLTNFCGSATSNAATITIGADCPADFNTDGSVNSQDFFDFLTAFFAGNADFNTDGVTNSQDFFDFLTAFFAGC